MSAESESIQSTGQPREQLSISTGKITEANQTIAHFHTYETHAKLRWLHQPLVDVLTREFRTRSREYYLEAIECGVVTVNGRRTSPMYKLRDLDVIHHTVHLHEPSPPEIEIIKDEANYTVINKPAGIPVHPTGGYFYYSVTKSLFPDTKVGCINRLDMPVSGVLLIAKSHYTEQFDLLKDATKVYVARVSGLFPATADVDRPLGSTNGRDHKIVENGKPSRTLFRRLDYRNGHSLVECQPITGRTHQIRIHIKSLGFPILNDVLYGDFSEPTVTSTESGRCAAADFPGAGESGCREWVEEPDKYACIVKHCKGENNRSFDIRKTHICLHAWKYTYDSTIYEAKWPKWADLDQDWSAGS